MFFLQLSIFFLFFQCHSTENLDDEMVKCRRSHQSIPVGQICDGTFNCCDRSDEEGCDAITDPVDYDVLAKTCQHMTIIDSGFDCNGTCIPWTDWCSQKGRKLFDQHSGECPQLVKTIQNENLCRNSTFWKEKTCQKCTTNSTCQDFTRCSGNYVGQCFFREKGAPLTNKTLCKDFSDQILWKDNFPNGDFQTQCKNHNFFMCGNEKACLHEKMKCDGIPQCTDKSDETNPGCAACPQLFGYSNSNEATLSCSHIDTKFPICAVPCDGKNDLCADNIDEDCEVASFKYSFLVTFVYLLFVISISLGQFIFQAERRKFKQNIEITDDHWPLYDLLQSSTDSTKNTNRSLSQFRKLHTQSSYRDQLTVVCNILLPQQDASNKDYAKMLMKYEADFHGGDMEQVNFCIKFHLGNSDRAIRLFSLAEEQTSNPVFFTRLISNVSMTMSFWAGLLQKLSLCTVTSIVGLAHMLSYSIDIIKDLYFIVLFILYFKNSLLNFNKFQAQIFAVIVTSMLLPALFNTTLVFTENPLAWLKSFWIRLGFSFLSPVCGSVSIFLSMKYTTEKSDLLRFFRIHNREYSMARLAHIESCLNKWNDLVARLRSNDNAFENFLQVAVLITISLLKFSSTNTVSGFQNLLAGDNLELIAIFTIISVVSIVLGSLKFYSLNKEETMTLKGKALISGFVMLSLIARIVAIIFYFSPTLGLLNLLGHWKRGKFSMDSEACQNNITFPQIETYDKLTVFQLDGYYRVLLVGVIVHYVLVFLIKYIFAIDFRTRKGFYVKILHVLNHLVGPFIYKDWDDNASDSLTTKKSWKRVSSEIKSLLVLFAVEHILMCIPVWILSYNIKERNYLLTSSFKILPEEDYSTRVAYTIAIIGPVMFCTIPFIQYRLFTTFHRVAHPWSRIINTYCYKPQSRNANANVVSEFRLQLQPFHTTDELLETYFISFWNNVVSQNVV